MPTLAQRIKARAEQVDAIGSTNLPEGVGRFTIKKEGVIKLRIVPYTVTSNRHPEAKKGEIWYRRPFGLHAKIGPSEKYVVCPLKTIGKPCPICEEYIKLQKDPDVEEAIADTLRPRAREVYNVIDIGGENKKMQVWEISRWNFGRHLDREIREGDESNASFCEASGGKILKVRMSEETTGKTPFLSASRIDFLDATTDLSEKTLSKVVDLDKSLNILSYEELKAILHGADEDEEEDDDDKIPMKFDKKGKSVKDEHDDDDEDEDEEEEEEKPDKKAKKSKKVEEDEEEDDDDGDDEVDDEDSESEDDDEDEDEDEDEDDEDDEE